MNKKKREGRMLTVKETAQKLGAAEISVRVWAAKGRFPGARKEETPMGEYWLIPEDALRDFEMSKPGPKPGAKKKAKSKPKVN